MELIYNSKKIIMLGRGGFFCLSLPSQKLLSLHNQNYVFNLPNLINNQIFLDHSLFLKKLIDV